MGSVVWSCPYAFEGSHMASERRPLMDALAMGMWREVVFDEPNGPERPLCASGAPRYVIGRDDDVRIGQRPWRRERGQHLTDLMQRRPAGPAHALSRCRRR